MTPPRTAWRRTVAAAALLIGLAGCGGGPATPERVDTLTPQAALAAAVDSTAEVASYRFELTSTSSGAGPAVEFRGGGVARADGSAAQMTFTLPGGMGELRQRILDGMIYMELPGQDGVFYELAVADLVDTSLAGSTDVTAGLEALRSASDDTVEVGEDTVRGEPTTHYRGTLDLSQAVEALQGPVRDMVEQVLASGDGEPAPFDAWIDEQGRLRKMEQTLTLAPPQLDGQELDVTTRFEMYDFGVEVDVEAPPASAVRDGAPLLDALGGALGS